MSEQFSGPGNEADTVFVHTGDTHLHSWQVLVKILESEDAMGMVVDVGRCVSDSPDHAGMENDELT